MLFFKQCPVSYNTPYEKIGDEVRSLVVPFDIPDGWVWIHPTDVGYFGSGKTPAPDQLSKFGTVPYFKVADMNAAGNEVYLCNSNSFLKAPDPMKLFSKGAVVYPKNGGAVFTNKKRILGQDSLVDLNTGCYTPFSQMDEKFFYYLFSTVDFQKYYKGTALPTVDMDAVQEIVWALPPLTEQRRIVTAIELTLPLIGKYEETHSQLSHLQDSFPEALKKSILQDAVQGKLVPQDPSDEPAEALLERIRVEKQWLIKEGKIKKDKHESVIFRRDNSHYEKRGPDEVCIDDALPFEIPENWTWARLSSACVSIADGDHQPPPQVQDGIPFLVISNVSDGRVDFSDTRYVPKEYFDSLAEIRIPQCGDLLFTVTGSYGIVIPVQTERKFCFQRHIALIKFSCLSPDFMKLWLSSPLVYEQCRRAATGTAQKTVGLASLKGLLIPIPPLNEQKRIVQKLNTLLALATL